MRTSLDVVEAVLRFGSRGEEAGEIGKAAGSKIVCHPRGISLGRLVGIILGNV